MLLRHTLINHHSSKWRTIVGHLLTKLLRATLLGLLSYCILWQQTLHSSRILTVVFTSGLVGRQKFNWWRWHVGRYYYRFIKMWGKVTHGLFVVVRMDCVALCIVHLVTCHGRMRPLSHLCVCHSHIQSLRLTIAYIILTKYFFILFLWMLVTK